MATLPRAIMIGATSTLCLVACDISDPGDPTATVVLAGVIVDTLGAPQAGVRVQARGYRGSSCEGGAAIANASGVSAADGRYLLVLQTLATTFTGCAELTLPDAAEPQVPIRALGVRFSEGASVDTIRATIVYRPATP